MESKTFNRKECNYMGYGQNLKDILDSKGMTVKELALKAKIAPTTDRKSVV